MRRGRAQFSAHPESSIGLPVADADLTLPATLGWSAARHATRPAMTFGSRTWTYSELAAEVDRCARGLLAAGAGPGTHVGLLMGARPEFVIGTYAAASVGATCVFLSTFSTDEELDALLRLGDVSILLATDEVRGRDVLGSLRSRHPSLPDPGLPLLTRLVPLSRWDELMRSGDAVDPAAVHARAGTVRPSHDALLLFTSGSTSTPKGVLHMQRAPAMQGFHMANCMAIGPDDRTFTSLPLFWSGGWATGVGAPFAVGACAVLQEYYDPAGAASLIERERVTSVRQMIHDELRLVTANAEADHDLSSVTVGVVTEDLGAVTSIEYEPLEICAWGMTETFTIATMLPFDAPADLRRRTMGRPVAGDVVHIRDPEHGHELASGEVGEITVGGLSLMKGYYKVEEPFPADADGCLVTGDAGMIDEDGYLVYMGRLDRMIKTAGVNVSPIEIEERLSEWGGLAQAAVVGVPHPALGAAVVLCAVRRAGDSVTEEAVTAALRGRLASYKVPRLVLFVDGDDLPLTVSSKVDVAALRRLCVDRIVGAGTDAEWATWLGTQHTMPQADQEATAPG